MVVAHSFAALGFAVLAAGCASSGAVGRDLPAALRARGLDPAKIEVPFAIDDEMKTWARAKVNIHAAPVEKLGLLLKALLAKEGMNLEYQGDYSVTAREVFR